MAYDTVLQVLKDDKTHATNNPGALGRGLDIVGVFLLWEGTAETRPDNTYYPMQKLGNNWIPRDIVAPAWCFISVIGVPDNILFNKFKSVLLSPDSTFNPVTGLNDVAHKKKFGRQSIHVLPEDALLNSDRPGYRNDGYITLSLNETLNVFYNRKDLRKLSIGDFQ